MRLTRARDRSSLGSRKPALKRRVATGESDEPVVGSADTRDRRQRTRRATRRGRARERQRGPCGGALFRSRTEADRRGCWRACGHVRPCRPRPFGAAQNGRRRHQLRGAAADPQGRLPGQRGHHRAAGAALPRLRGIRPRQHRVALRVPGRAAAARGRSVRPAQLGRELCREQDRRGVPAQAHQRGLRAAGHHRADLLVLWPARRRRHPADRPGRARRGGERLSRGAQRPYPALRGRLRRQDHRRRRGSRRSAGRSSTSAAPNR